MMSVLRIPLGALILMYQSFVLAISQVWANKTRSILTTLGIVIGVASVSTIIAALSGLKQNVLEQLQQFGTNNAFIFPDRPQTGPMRLIPWRQLVFKPEDFDGMVEFCPSLKSLMRQVGMQQTVHYERHSEDQVQITGVDPTWHDIQNRPVILGRPFTEMDNELSRPVCVINTALRDKLGLPKECIGQIIEVARWRFVVIGVIDPRPANMFEGGGSSSSECFTPFRTLYKDIGGRRVTPFIFAIAQTKSADLSDEAKGEMSFYLRQKRRERIGDPDTFQVQFVSEAIDTFKQISATVTMVAAGIVGISLLVGGVGIMNIMLVSVSERTREIGLRKAVGARPAAVMFQFLVEAVFLCLLGGLMGLVIAQALTFLLAYIPNAHLEKAFIPAWAVALSFGFSASVGLIFGMFPAIKAARLDPIEALRHE
jgi:putative ABC transport system permease protein